MTGATIFVVGMFVLLFVYWIVLMLLFRDNTVVRERESSNFELIVQKIVSEMVREFVESMRELRQALEVTLLPAIEEANRAFDRFGALLRENSNYKKRR